MRGSTSFPATCTAAPARNLGRGEAIPPAGLPLTLPVRRRRHRTPPTRRRRRPVRRHRRRHRRPPCRRHRPVRHGLRRGRGVLDRPVPAQTTGTCKFLKTTTSYSEANPRGRRASRRGMRAEHCAAAANRGTTARTFDDVGHLFFGHNRRRERQGRINMRVPRKGRKACSTTREGHRSD
jgi:hypothetical protein